MFAAQFDISLVVFSLILYDWLCQTTARVLYQTYTAEINQLTDQPTDQQTTKEWGVDFCRFSVQGH